MMPKINLSKLMAPLLVGKAYLDRDNFCSRQMDLDISVSLFNSNLEFQGTLKAEIIPLFALVLSIVTFQLIALPGFLHMMHGIILFLYKLTFGSSLSLLSFSVINLMFGYIYLATNAHQTFSIYRIYINLLTPLDYFIYVIILPMLLLYAIKQKFYFIFQWTSE